MAAPTEKHEDGTASDNITMHAVREMKSKESSLSSKQLLYSEKFPDSASDRLKILHPDSPGNQKLSRGEHKTYKVPQSSVLSQVKGFLPRLQSSNAELERRLHGGESWDLDIENVESCTGPVIEMNLAVVEMDGDIIDETESDSSDSNSDSDCEEINMELGSVTENNIRLTQSKDKKTKGSIIELISSDEESVSPRETTLKSDDSLQVGEKCNGVVT